MGENSVDYKTGRPIRVGDKTNLFERGDTVSFLDVFGDYSAGVVLSIFVAIPNINAQFHCDIAKIRDGRFVGVTYQVLKVFRRRAVLTEKVSANYLRWGLAALTDT